MDITPVIGDYSWKLHDDRNIAEKVYQTDGQTDRRADRTDRRTEVFLQLLGRS